MKRCSVDHGISERRQDDPPKVPSFLSTATFLYTREDLIMQLITPHPVQSVTITILADNFLDGLLPDQGIAKRASLSTQKLGVTTALMEGGQKF